MIKMHTDKARDNCCEMNDRKLTHNKQVLKMWYNGVYIHLKITGKKNHFFYENDTLLRSDKMPKLANCRIGMMPSVPLSRKCKITWDL